MDIVHYDTTEKFVRAAAQWIAAEIVSAVRNRGRATVGLSGGTTPKPVYTMLGADQHIPWGAVTFFLLDERYVPSDHADSNTRMIEHTLHTRSGAASQLLTPDTNLPIEACIAQYAEDLKNHTKPDLVIIGMGDDGHITSLFPPLSPEAFGPQTVIRTTTERFAGRERVSVTLPVLLNAEKRLFLITGKAKADLLNKMQREAEDVSLYPAQYLFDERTTWMVGDGA